jgi:hypothetical protein
MEDGQTAYKENLKMTDKITLPSPLFFTVAKGSTTMFINAAHVVKIEIEAVNLASGILHLDDGTQVELDANAAGTIMRLMAYHSHEQMQILSEFKRLGGN